MIYNYFLGFVWFQLWSQPLSVGVF